MNLSVDLGMLAERVVVLHEFTASLFVQARLGERHNQKASNYFKDVSEGPLCRGPVPLEGVDTDFTGARRHVRVENLRHEVALRGALREPCLNDQFAAEDTAFVCCLDCSLKQNETNIRHVRHIRHEKEEQSPSQDLKVFSALTWSNNVRLDV